MISGRWWKIRAGPLMHLTDLQLFYERPDWSPWCNGLGRNGLPSDLQLPHNKNHLTFAFTGISLAYPEKSAVPVDAGEL